MSDDHSLQRWLDELLELEEDELIAICIHMVDKKWHKAWHDRKIWCKIIQPWLLILMYDNKFLKNPNVTQMSWLGTFRIVYINDDGALNLVTLDGQPLKEFVNAS